MALLTRQQEDNRIVRAMADAFAELLEDTDRPISVEVAVVQSISGDFGATYVERAIGLLPRIRREVQEMKGWATVPITDYYFSNYSDNEEPDTEVEIQRCVSGTAGPMQNCNSSPTPVGLCRVTEDSPYAKVYSRHRVNSTKAACRSTAAICEAMGTPLRLDGEKLVEALLPNIESAQEKQ